MAKIQVNTYKLDSNGYKDTVLKFSKGNYKGYEYFVMFQGNGANRQYYGTCINLNLHTGWFTEPTDASSHIESMIDAKLFKK